MAGNVSRSAHHEIKTDPTEAFASFARGGLRTDRGVDFGDDGAVVRDDAFPSYRDDGAG